MRYDAHFPTVLNFLNIQDHIKSDVQCLNPDTTEKIKFLVPTCAISFDKSWLFNIATTITMYCKYDKICK